MENYYVILGISLRATAEEIKAAYKQKAKQYHPDKNPGSAWAEEQFKKVSEAYQTLSDPYKKDLYDLRLAYTLADADLRSRTQSSTPPPQSTYQGPNPYGGPFTGTRTQTSGRYASRTRNYAPPRGAKADEKKARYTLHTFALSFLGVATVLILLNWWSQIRAESQAQTYVEQGQWQEALARYPTYAPAWRASAEFWLQQGDLFQARQAIDQAIQLSDYPKAENWIIKGKILAKSGAFDEADKAFRSAVNMNPENGNAQYFLADFLLAYRQQADEAYPHALRATELQAGEGRNWLALGFAAFRTQRYSKALSAFNRAESLGRSDAELFYLRGFCQFSAGNPQMACKDWLAAEKAGHPQAREALTTHCPTTTPTP